VVSRKAVALISGGLDSVLAAKIIMEQGFDVVGLYFTSPFSKSYGNEKETHAARVSKAIGIDLRVIDMGQDYIDLVRKPVHGYGKNINPCIDCKIFMLWRAKAVMQELYSPFVVTGEVLGQRPMSQRRDTFHVIERDADMCGMILRPLSAPFCHRPKLNRTASSGGKHYWESAVDRVLCRCSSLNGMASAVIPRPQAAAC